MSADGLGRAFSHGRPALVTYLMAGYPDRATSLECMHAAARAGADLIELGVPYGDALADGPVIVRAANAAMHDNPGCFGLAEAIELAAEFIASAQHPAPPVALMTYLNPVMRMGLEVAATRMRDAGVGGVIVPDMPPEVAGEWLAVSDGLDTVFLVAPTSTVDRTELVGRLSSGFVYCVSTTGVTGERADLPEELPAFVAQMRAHTTLPLAVGFGVGSPEIASAVAAMADGVIVGSAIVKRQEEPAILERFVETLAQAIHGV